MKSIIKRLLNVITALAMLSLMYELLRWGRWTFDPPTTKMASTDEYAGMRTVTPETIISDALDSFIFLVLLIVGTVNYIFFGKFSLWHKNDKP